MCCRRTSGGFVVCVGVYAVGGRVEVLFCSGLVGGVSKLWEN